MIGFIVDTEFVWGFQARIVGLSKTSPSFYYPPPTTFLGALAEVIAKENNIGEDLGRFIINELSKNLLAIGFRPLNCVPIKYEDLNRIITIRRVGVKDRQTGKDIGILAPHPLYLDKSFDSPARGKTILVSLDDDAPKIRWFLIFKNREIGVQDNELRAKIDIIFLDENIFWKIHRLGSKESRVCVTDLKVFKEVRINSGTYLITNYSFPTIAVSKSEEKIRRWENELYIDPFGGKLKRNSEYVPHVEDIYIKTKGKKKTEKSGIFDKYVRGFENLRVFKIPIIVSTQTTPEYIVMLKDDWKAYSVSYDNRKEVVIGI